MILYLLVSVAIAASAFNFMMKRGQGTGASIFMVLFIIIFIYYGIRWFGSNIFNAADSVKVAWPPIVNMCPDFMVMWTDTQDGGKVYCYDAKNLYELKTAGSNFGLTSQLTINNVAGQSAYLIKNPTQNTGATDLASDTNGSRWPFAYKLLNNLNSITTSGGKSNLMRWEGVWDGVTTPTSANIPFP